MNDDGGLRKTKQRKKLLDILKSKSEPLTADELLKICQRDCPNMALTTVYRNLDRMIDLGFATKIESKTTGAARYAAREQEKRVALVCRGCNQRIELKGVSLDELENQVECKTGYEIEHRYIEFFGLCPVCQHREFIR